MRSKVFSAGILWMLFGVPLYAQYTISGTIIDESGVGIMGVEVHDQTEKVTTVTNHNGQFELVVQQQGEHEIVAFNYQYDAASQSIEVYGDTSLDFTIYTLRTNLNEVTIYEEPESVFNVARLNMVEGTAIYAGKKSEVVLMDQLVGNKAANNARQIYAQVVGLNIFDSGNAGLQLSVGGRGLDPNRTANFNTRQNSYDISADVLGYPESYYTPPAEAISEIQIIRGAASLQYGTQFGGLINFQLHRPSLQPVEFQSRQSIGSKRIHHFK